MTERMRIILFCVKVAVLKVIAERRDIKTFMLYEGKGGLLK